MGYEVKVVCVGGGAYIEGRPFREKYTIGDVDKSGE